MCGWTCGGHADQSERAERLKEGAEEIEDVAYGEKDEKTKQSSKRRSEDDEDKDHSSRSSSEDHEKAYPKSACRRREG